MAEGPGEYDIACVAAIQATGGTEAIAAARAQLASTDPTDGHLHADHLAHLLLRESQRLQALLDTAVAAQREGDNQERNRFHALCDALGIPGTPRARDGLSWEGLCERVERGEAALRPAVTEIRGTAIRLIERMERIEGRMGLLATAHQRIEALEARAANSEVTIGPMNVGPGAGRSPAEVAASVAGDDDEPDEAPDFTSAFILGKLRAAIFDLLKIEPGPMPDDDLVPMVRARMDYQIRAANAAAMVRVRQLEDLVAAGEQTIADLRGQLSTCDQVARHFAPGGCLPDKRESTARTVQRALTELKSAARRARPGRCLSSTEVGGMVTGCVLAEGLNGPHAGLQATAESEALGTFERLQSVLRADTRTLALSDNDELVHRLIAAVIGP